MSTPQRYLPDPEWRDNGMSAQPDGDYILFSDHEQALAELKAKEYGRGVTAGKLEAAAYTPEERENYGKVVAQYDDWKELKSALSTVSAERDKLKAELGMSKERELQLRDRITDLQLTLKNFLI